MTNNLQKCGYPLTVINKAISEARCSRSGTATQKSKSRQTDPKAPLIKIPFISEAFTRIVKGNLRRAGLGPVVVIVQSGKNLRRNYHKPTTIACTCDTCASGIPCTARNIVYEATCRQCVPERSYIGVTTRPFKHRYYEHGLSIRNADEKSALQTHLQTCTNTDKSCTGFTWSIIDRGSTFKDCFIRESINITTHRPSLNRNQPGWTL